MIHFRSDVLFSSHTYPDGSRMPGQVLFGIYLDEPVLWAGPNGTRQTRTLPWISALQVGSYREIHYLNADRIHSFLSKIDPRIDWMLGNVPYLRPVCGRGPREALKLKREQQWLQKHAEECVRLEREQAKRWAILKPQKK